MVAIELPHGRRGAVCAAAGNVDRGGSYRASSKGSRTGQQVALQWSGLGEEEPQVEARIWHDGKRVHLGNFEDDKEAAEGFDAKARELRGQQQAHGGRSGTTWWWLNFPTAAEEQYAQQQGMPAKKV